jgi:hypothetical protein
LIFEKNLQRLRMLDHPLVHCHAREAGHPVITDRPEKIAALAISGSSAFTDNDD